MALILDEKQVNNIRLLILDKEKDTENSNVEINGKAFTTVDVYDLPNSLAIVCDANERSFIGMMI